MNSLTVFVHKIAGVVEDEVVEGIALPIQVRLPAKAGGGEVGEPLEGSEGRLALVHRHSGTGNCGGKN